MERRGHPIMNVTLAPNVPIIEYKKYMALNKPYDFFNELVVFLATYDDLIKNREEIIEGIENFSDIDHNFYCDIFLKPVYRVAGYIVAQSKDKDTIFLFGYENNTKEEFE